MQAGKLDRRITLQRATLTTDAYNAIVETFAPLSTVWAQAVPVSDGEKMRAGEVYSNLSMRFTIRWSTVVATLDTKDRVLFDGRLFDILGIKEIGRHEGLEITAATRGER